MMHTPASRDVRPYTDCNAVRLPHVWQAGILTGPAPGDRQWWDCLYCPVSTVTAAEREEVGGVDVFTYARPSQYLPSASQRRMAETWDRGIEHA